MGIFISQFEQGEISPDLFRKACECRLEGLVSKRRDSAYRLGWSICRSTSAFLSAIHVLLAACVSGATAICTNQNYVDQVRSQTKVTAVHALGTSYDFEPPRLTSGGSFFCPTGPPPSYDGAAGARHPDAHPMVPAPNRPLAKRLVLRLR
jgi:hypothetical protein